ncbi:MAG: fused MFS/spermidine synthase [Candidatus Latescibacterota bacterium]|nr:MAG: fused MFS/spermidine synthase [Candidatus Latescibacterota bacterium]
MSSVALYVIVFISGASVLAVEILGTRILGPFYGVSLFLWSALITVTLAALSVGYAIGGRWADRGPRFSRLAWMMTGAGLWLFLVPWIRRPLLELLEPVGLRAAVLFAATLLFFPPLMLLGMVSPYAIRLKALRLDEVGRTAGSIYAISTVASVVAALATGFLLIPNVGVVRLTMWIGLFLLVGAGVAWATDRASGVQRLVALLLIVAGGVVAAALPVGRADPERGLLAVEQSPYAEIRVVEVEDTRILFIDGGGHTIVDRLTGETLFPYAVVMDLLENFYDERGDMLLVGLGGGSIARSFAMRGWSIDAVEIDPVVVRFAYDYFRLEPWHATVHTMDARHHLLTHDKSYDLIVLDAFGSSAIPFHLVTQEAFGLVASRLNSDGVLALNVESHGWRTQLVRSLAATLRQHFAHVRAMPLSEPPTTFGNLVLLASQRELEFDEDRLERALDYISDPYMHWAVLQRNHAWDNRFEPQWQQARVLTDDLNPVDVWSENLNLEARRVLHGDENWNRLGW